LKAYSRFPAVLAGLLLLLPGMGFLRPVQAQDNIIKRAYHDVTARDNAYFNANLKNTGHGKRSSSASRRTITKSCCPFSSTGSKKRLKAWPPTWTMSSSGRPSPFSSTKTANGWTMPTCWWEEPTFYKREYDKALESFQYLISEYQDIDKPKKKKSSGKKKKKKKKKKKSSADEDLASQDKPLSWLKHHKKSPESALWVVRTFD
jgi:hypothetical protein